MKEWNLCKGMIRIQSYPPSSAHVTAPSLCLLLRLPLAVTRNYDAARHQNIRTKLISNVLCEARCNNATQHKTSPLCWQNIAWELYSNTLVDDSQTGLKPNGLWNASSRKKNEGTLGDIWYDELKHALLSVEKKWFTWLQHIAYFWICYWVWAPTVSWENVRLQAPQRLRYASYKTMGKDMESNLKLQNHYRWSESRLVWMSGKLSYFMTNVTLYTDSILFLQSSSHH